jgi:hypothetical protein
MRKTVVFLMAVLMCTAACSIAFAAVSPQSITGKAGDHVAITVTEGYEIDSIKAFANGNRSDEMVLLGVHPLVKTGLVNIPPAEPEDPPSIRTGKVMGFQLYDASGGQLLISQLIPANPAIQRELEQAHGNVVSLYSFHSPYITNPYSSGNTLAMVVNLVWPQLEPYRVEGILKKLRETDGSVRWLLDDGRELKINLFGKAGDFDPVIAQIMRENVNKTVTTKIDEYYNSSGGQRYAILADIRPLDNGTVVVVGLKEGLKRITLIVNEKGPGGQRSVYQIPVYIQR